MDGSFGPVIQPRGTAVPDAPSSPIRKIISWNLLRTTGASLDDVVRLIRRERPDLLLMQEATHHIEGLCARVGGTFARAPLPGRIHGPAMWSPTPWAQPPKVVALPSGSMFERGLPDRRSRRVRGGQRASLPRPGAQPPPASPHRWRPAAQCGRARRLQPRGPCPAARLPRCRTAPAHAPDGRPRAAADRPLPGAWPGLPRQRRAAPRALRPSSHRCAPRPRRAGGAHQSEAWRAQRYGSSSRAAASRSRFGRPWCARSSSVRRAIILVCMRVSSCAARLS